jgi:acyl-homoserine-lactone acylase
VYQLTLVPGQPTEYLYDGKPEKMTSTTVTVPELENGTLKDTQHTLWYSRYGPVIDSLEGIPLPWSDSSAFVLDDANASNLRMLNSFLDTDMAHSVAQDLAILKKYEAVPWVNTVATDTTGRALYADVLPVPHVTDAEAERCDTPVGTVLFSSAGLPVLNGSLPSCALGTDKDSAVPGIFGASELPTLTRLDYVENSNDSFWLSNLAQPLTGFPQIVGNTNTPRSLRTRSALTMVTDRIAGTDGLGPAGFTLQDMENLMYSDIQFGATLDKAATVAMCRSFPGGLAPLSSGGTIAVGDSCGVLAAWNGREDVGSRGAILWRAFWERALALPSGPWSQPFNPADPVSTPSGLDASSTGVQQAFGDALAELTAEHLPYDVPLGEAQYVLANGKQIPLPGGPGDPDGEFNAIYQAGPGTVTSGSSYIQAVTWAKGDACPQAGTILSYSESANPLSPYYSDQTELFSQSKWVTAWFCPAQVAAHAVSVTEVSGS